jgi:hypothetical protein
MSDGETTLESFDPYKQRLTYWDRKQRRTSQEFNGEIFLAPTEEEPLTSVSETDWEGSYEPEDVIIKNSTRSGSTDFLDTQCEESFPAIHSTDSDDSVLRFKEVLYRHLGGGGKSTNHRQQTVDTNTRL